MKIHSKIKDYTVQVAENIFDKKSAAFKDLPEERLFYFVDANVYRIYEKKVKKFIGNSRFVAIKALETNKEYLQIARYYRDLIQHEFSRKDTLVTIGGGILQDISGFIASTLYRGISWVFIPTTLLSQADSCIGSKTSINFDGNKNLIGSFYPPDRIYIDAGFCKTLTDQYFNSGIGEIIKFHLMADERRYADLKKYLALPDLRDSKPLKKIILSTLQIKKSYFDRDELDKGVRNLLNYGHCFGHALESASGFKVSHGEAVVVGMGFSNLLSLRKGLMKQAKYDEFENILRNFYPHFDLSAISADTVIKYMQRDKKRTGKDLTVILSRGIGRQIKADDIKESEIRKTYAEFLKVYPK